MKAPQDKYNPERSGRQNLLARIRIFGDDRLASIELERDMRPGSVESTRRQRR